MYLSSITFITICPTFSIIRFHFLHSCTRLFSDFSPFINIMSTQEQTQYATDFTDADNSQPATCGCGDTCKGTRVYPPGTKFHFFHSNNATQPGRYVCDACNDHYKRKQTTTHCTSTITVSAHHHQKDIHQQVAKAQRGGKKSFRAHENNLLIALF